MNVIGILGGGQLARMLTLAAYPLGIHTLCIDPSPEACARDVTQVITAPLTEETALSQFLSKVELVTYETENIPLSCATLVEQTHSLYPSAHTLKIAQDRLHEKTFFQSLQIPTPAFAAISNQAQLKQAAAELGLPAVLKTRRMGYDGKGQIVIKTSAELDAAWGQLTDGQSPANYILEQFIAFEYELSLIAVRNRDGEIRFYPLARNHHTHGILRWSEAPFIHLDLLEQAQNYMVKVLKKLAYVGVLTIEFFYDGKQLIANEMAPRVHNSGHWTIEGAQTSQFENHLRAILNWPLGSTATTGHCFMLNCIGEMASPQTFLSIRGVHYHSYEKSPRPGRKLGHITLVEADPKQYAQSKQTLCEIKF